MSNVPVSAPISYPFKTGKSWAGDYYTVIPGTREDKSPMTKWKHLVWPERLLPTKEESIRWRALGMTEEANPLLLLDSPESEAMCLCVVDVDDVSALKDVLAWFISLGITNTLQVTSGRVGGGAHFYFRRSVAGVRSYQSGHAVQFGKFTKANGKESYKVDLKGYNSYVATHGSVHRSGAVYTATYGGTPVSSLDDVLHLIPVFPAEEWVKARGSISPEDGESGVQWLVAGKEWEQVVADGRERQSCPWCMRGDNRILAYSEDKGTAHCYFERTTRKLRKALPDMPILDTIAESAEGNEVLSAKHWAGYFIDQVVRRVTIDPDDIVILDDVDDRKGLEKKLSVARKLTDSRYGADVGHYISCSKAPVICIGSGSSKAGRYTELRGTCRSMACPDCGPHLVECMRSSTLGEALILTFGSMDAAMGDALEDRVLGSANECSLTKGTESTGQASMQNQRSLPGRLFGDSQATFARRMWCASLRRPSAGHDSLRKLFEQHVARTGGSFQWLGVHISPTEIVYIFFFACDGSGDPRSESTLWYLFEDETPTVGRFDMLVQDAYTAVDLEAWALAISKGAAQRIHILVGPSDLTASIQDIFDWLTGRSRKAKAAPDAQRHAIATYKPEDVREFLGKTFQESLVLEETKTTKEGAKSRSAKLPSSPGPAMKNAVANGELDSSSGHRKKVRSDTVALDILLAEEPEVAPTKKARVPRETEKQKLAREHSEKFAKLEAGYAVEAEALRAVELKWIISKPE